MDMKQKINRLCVHDRHSTFRIVEHCLMLPHLARVLNGLPKIHDIRRKIAWGENSGLESEAQEIKS